MKINQKAAVSAVIITIIIAVIGVAAISAAYVVLSNDNDDNEDSESDKTIDNTNPKDNTDPTDDTDPKDDTNPKDDTDPAKDKDNNSGSSGDSSSTKKPIVITDGSGAKITLTKPLTAVITCNTNIPKAMKIMGLENELKGLSFYSASSDQSNYDMFHPLFPNAKHMDITPNMTAEAIVDSGVKYVICPVSSMTVTAANQTSYEQLGITVIRLDCTGDTAMEDFEKLTTLFGKTSNVMKAYNEYKSTYNTVVKNVKKAAPSGNDEPTFLYFMNSSTAFYNQTSAGSEMIESIYGTNALRSISGLDKSGVTNSANETGLAEVIKVADDKKNMDYIFIRGATTTTSASSALTMWNGCLLNTNVIYNSLSGIGADSTGHIYVFNSNMMSGPLAYVGYVLIAMAYGIDTGYDAATLIQEYNEKYGFNETASGLMFEITIAEGIAVANQMA